MYKNFRQQIKRKRLYLVTHVFYAAYQIYWKQIEFIQESQNNQLKVSPNKEIQHLTVYKVVQFPMTHFPRNIFLLFKCSNTARYFSATLEHKLPSWHRFWILTCPRFACPTILFHPNNCKWNQFLTEYHVHLGTQL